MKLNAVTIDLSAANILAMYATPVTVLAAPGSGRAIVVERFVFNYTGGTAFASGGAIGLYQGSTIQTGTLAASVIVASGASDSINKVEGASSAVTENTAVTISNASGAFTTGTGTAKLTVYFSVINV